MLIMTLIDLWIYKLIKYLGQSIYLLVDSIYFSVCRIIFYCFRFNLWVNIFLSLQGFHRLRVIVGASFYRCSFDIRFGEIIRPFAIRRARRSIVKCFRSGRMCIKYPTRYSPRYFSLFSNAFVLDSRLSRSSSGTVSAADIERGQNNGQGIIARRRKTPTIHG